MLPEAVRRLAEIGTITAASEVWETAPEGRQDQPNFLNAVILLETSLSADEAQRKIRNIEAHMGRRRDHDPLGPRSIDIDLLLFNHDILRIGHRDIPSPEVLERAFVAIPLAQIAPDYIHPLTRKTLADIARTFQIDPRKMRLREDVRLE